MSFLKCKIFHHRRIQQRFIKRSDGCLRVFIQFAIVQVLCLQPQLVPIASARQTGEGILPFESVRLRIDFASELFESSLESVRLEQFETACRVWKEAFLIGQGPWGFGIASEVTCRLKMPGEASSFQQLKGFDEWLLTLKKDKIDKTDVIRAEICRASQVSAGGPWQQSRPEEKCEAQKIIPWTEHRVRLLRFRSFVRLLAASLYDQLPFLSAVARNRTPLDRSGLRGHPEVDTPEVSFPSPPAQISFVEAGYEQKEGRFRLKEISQREALLCSNREKQTCWLVGKIGRGKRSEEFNRRLREAFVILTEQFQVDLMKAERARIKEDIGKLKEKPANLISVRGAILAGLPLFSLRSSYGGGASLGVRSGSGFAISLHTLFLQSDYMLETEVEEKYNAQNVVHSKIALREVEFSVEPKLHRSFSPALNPDFNYHVGARFGLVVSDGDLRSGLGLPQNDLKIKASEFVLGGSLGAGLPVGQRFLFSAAAQGVLGLRAKSSSLSGTGEFVWVVSRIPNQLDVHRLPSLKIGTGVQLSSLNRLFVTADAAAAVQTAVTLNGVQISVFIENNF